MLNKIKIWLGVLVLIGIVALGLSYLTLEAQEKQEKKKRLLIPQKDFRVDIGKMEYVFNESQEQRWGMLSSDMFVPVIKKDGLFYWWITAIRNDIMQGVENWSYRLVGSDLTSMKPDPIDEEGRMLAVLKNEPQFFEDYVGITAVYFDEKAQRLYAWYHSEDHKFPEYILKASKMMFYPPHPDYPFYVTIGAAVSTDFGRTFKKLGPALKAPATKEDAAKAVLENPESYWNVEMGTPSLIKIEDYLYLYYCDQSPDGYSGISVARLKVEDLVHVPQPWKKYYNGIFKEQGLGGKFEAIVDAVYASVSYNKYLKEFLMVHAGPGEQKIFLRASQDGLNWSEPLLLVDGDSAMWNVYPTLMDDGEDPTVTDENFWLYYNHSPNITEVSLRMVRRKIHLKKK